MSLPSHQAPPGGGDFRPSRPAPGANVYGSARVAAPPPQPAPARTYRAQRPTLPDVPPAVVTAPGPAWPLLALPVGLLAVVLSLVGLNRQMWIDEYVTVYVAGLNWSQFGKLMGNQDLVHGAYYVFMRFWTDVAGTSMVALRLPSIIGMGVTAGALTLLGRRLFSTRAGLLAGLAFAVLPTVSHYGQEVRSYAMVSALVVLATLLLTYAIERPESYRWLLYTAAMVAVSYLHLVAALVLLPHALLVLHGWRRERERAMGWWLVCATAVVAALAPLVYFANGQSAQVNWITADEGAVRGYPGQLFGSDTVVLTVVGLALVGVIQLARSRAGNMFAVLVWAVFPPVFCYVTFDLVHLFLAKYVLYTLPAWALLVGGVLGVPKPRPEPVSDPKSDVPPWAAPAGRKPWLGRWAAAGTALVFLAVAVVGVPAHRELRRDPLIREPDFRGAAAVVDRGFQPGDVVVYAGTHRLARLPFQYELKTAPKDVFAAVPSGDNGWFHPQDCGDMAACLGESPRVWLVLTNFTENDDWFGLQESQKKLLDGPYEKASTVRLENIRVLLLERRQT